MGALLIISVARFDPFSSYENPRQAFPLKSFGIKAAPKMGLNQQTKSLF